MAKDPACNERSDRGAEDERNRSSETRHLLRNPANAARLTAAIDEADKGHLVGHELLDVAADTPGT